MKKMKKMKNLIFLVLVCLGISCSDDCVTCKEINNPENEMEYCDDPEITYTDENGNEITFSELIDNLSGNFWICE